MGHIRLGEFPRTRKWEQVVELIKRDGDATAVAAAALDAAESGFRQAAEDEGLGRATWLLTQIPRAARDRNYLDRLRSIGMSVAAAPGRLDLVGAFTDAVDAHTRRTGGRTDLGEIVRRERLTLMRFTGSPASLVRSCNGLLQWKIRSSGRRRPT